jgi:hypothetical protein
MGESGGSEQKPSPLMGEGWVGVAFDEALRAGGDSAPPQPLPIKGRG